MVLKKKLQGKTFEIFLVNLTILIVILYRCTKGLIKDRASSLRFDYKHFGGQYFSGHIN